MSMMQRALEEIAKGDIERKIASQDHKLEMQAINAIKFEYELIDLQAHINKLELEKAQLELKKTRLEIENRVLEERVTALAVISSYNVQVQDAQLASLKSAIDDLAMVTGISIDMLAIKYQKVFVDKMRTHALNENPNISSNYNQLGTRSNLECMFNEVRKDPEFKGELSIIIRDITNYNTFVYVNQETICQNVGWLWPSTPLPELFTNAANAVDKIISEKEHWLKPQATKPPIFSNSTLQGLTTSCNLAISIGNKCK